LKLYLKKMRGVNIFFGKRYSNSKAIKNKRIEDDQIISCYN